MGTFETTRSAQIGPAARPVAIPEDLGECVGSKSSGSVALPLRVRWSGPLRTYDLADRHDRLLAYEQVMAEGTEEDVRAFIDVDEVVALWDDLVLPRHVRRAWATWLNRRRGLTLPC